MNMNGGYVQAPSHITPMLWEDGVQGVTLDMLLTSFGLSFHPSPSSQGQGASEGIGHKYACTCVRVHVSGQMHTWRGCSMGLMAWST